MTSLRRELQYLKMQLMQRAPRIKKSAYLADLSFSSIDRGEFTVTASWGNTSSSGDNSGSTQFVFNLDNFSQLNLKGAVLKKSVCLTTETMIKDILRLRGVPV
jgi:hypothetical protein